MQPYEVSNPVQNTEDPARKMRYDLGVTDSELKGNRNNKNNLITFGLATIVVLLCIFIVGNYMLNKENKTQVNSNEGVTGTKNAICMLYPDNKSGVTGSVSFQQEDFSAATKIVVSIKGLSPNSVHAMHIHEFGDLTDGCTTCGTHYNPFKKNHGGPMDSVRHVGDLGNLKANDKGEVFFSMKDIQVKLQGENSVIGRSVVLHAGEDDLGKGGNAGSLLTGNAGVKKLACGTIGLSGKFNSLPPQ